MVSTTMYYCPGAPVMRSRDLVHWEIVSYIYDVIEDDDIYNLRDGKNAYGKGRVYFFTAICPSYGHVTSRWEMNPNKFDFWPGVRETYEKLAREGLARAGTEPAVDLLGAPKDLDVVAYSQNGGDRLVVHMLDYDTSRMEIPSVTLRINGNRAIKAAYRPGAKPLAPAGRTVRLGKLSVYDMVVVDFE